MKTILIGAGSDLGIHVDGARLAPKLLFHDLASFYQGEQIILEQDANIFKSRSLADKRKNQVELQRFNKKLYDTINSYLENEYFPITVGGDQSISISSSLANLKKHENIGLIYFCANTGYDTFESTATGNLHNLSLAAINGYHCPELTDFHSGHFINSGNTVIIGVREMSKSERENIKYSGATVFTMDDIKTQGMDAVLERAFQIASEKTNGIHIGFHLNILDPSFSTGVSIPVEDGFSEDIVMEILNSTLKHIEQVTSFDLVGLNPTRDTNRKTEQIAVNMLAKIIMAVTKRQ